MLSHLNPVLPHIQIETDPSGRVCLRVEDYELFDFVEDYLAEECDLSIESIAGLEGVVITGYFPAGTKAEAVEAALLRLRPEEFEAVYLRNNAGTP